MNNPEDNKKIDENLSQKIQEIFSSILPLDGTSKEMEQPPQFSICFSLGTNGEPFISIDMEYDEKHILNIARLLSSINNGLLNKEILTAFAVSVGNSKDKRRLVQKILKKWDSVDNYPYIEPLQTIHREQ